MTVVTEFTTRGLLSQKKCNPLRHRNIYSKANIKQKNIKQYKGVKLGKGRGMKILVQYLSTYAHLSMDLDLHTSSAAASNTLAVDCATPVVASVDIIAWRKSFSLCFIALIKFSWPNHLWGEGCDESLALGFDRSRVSCGVDCTNNGGLTGDKRLQSAWTTMTVAGWSFRSADRGAWRCVYLPILG